MSKTTFLYHAEAVGASGHISLPVVDAMPVQGSISSGVGETFGKARVENFKHLDYLSIGSIESHIVTSYSKKDQAHGGLSSVVIEDLKTLNVVTCDRMMTRLTSKHNGKKDSQPSFHLHGTHFDGLSLAGNKIDLQLAVGLFSELSTWDELNHAYETKPDIRKELDALAVHPTGDGKLPVHNGVFACTLAHIPESLPRGMKRVEGQGIEIPHFGIIYPAQFYISATSRRLRMLHVDLGCSVEGCNGFGDTSGSGSPMPGSS